MNKRHLIILAMMLLLVSATSLLAADEQVFSLKDTLLNEDTPLFRVDMDLLKGHSASAFNDLSSTESSTFPLLRLNSNIDLPPVIDETVQIGKAFAANLFIHELGHKAMADYADAQDTKMNFFTHQDGQFFLGQSTFTDINEESRLSFSLAGEVAADLTFEQALKSYRIQPTVFNTSLLLFSGTDFLRYCIYAFYMTDGHPHYDPIAISHETGLSRETILSVALAKTIINAYRVYSGKDYVIPYFSADRRSASLNFIMEF